MNALSKIAHKAHSAGRPDDIPVIGDWYWVKCDEDAEGEKSTIKVEYLFCVRHLASNHVQLVRTVCDSESWVSVRYRDLLKLTRHEPNWKAIKERDIEQKKVELQAAVAALTDAVQNAGLIAVEGEGTLLPALTRQSPEDSKRALLRLKEQTYPALHKDVEMITQQITALHRDMMLPMKVQSERMGEAVERVDERLFALELYAGLFQGTVCLCKGKPADAESPIVVRQMLRYMDEECLIDYDRGGMDFDKISDFDEWVAKPENYSRLVPEQRSVVALRVRRYEKDYGPCKTIAEAYRFSEMNRANMFTYLLLRNGEQLHRLWAEVDFSPRLLPFRDEFIRPFEEKSYSFKTHRDEVDKVITPDDLSYDDHVNKRKRKLYEYNRVMFLLQGLLDRSKVFAPHPPINLGDADHVQRYFRAIYDEELGLPSANPPSWEQYRSDCNARIVKGSWVWSNYYDQSDYEYNRYESRERLRAGRSRDDICKVDRVSKDRLKVRVSWPWGTRYGRQFRGRYMSSGPWGEWPVDKERHAWLPVKEVFNVSAYKSGDYKRFLCDAYLKGAYLKWAPQLLAAEDWLKKVTK